MPQNLTTEKSICGSDNGLVPTNNEPLRETAVERDLSRQMAFLSIRELSMILFFIYMCIFGPNVGHIQFKKNRE